MVVVGVESQGRLAAIETLKKSSKRQVAGLAGTRSEGISEDRDGGNVGKAGYKEFSPLNFIYILSFILLTPALRGDTS